MSLHFIDLLIIGLYLVATVFIGFWISHLAGKNIQNYFLGGNKIKWYYLGLSNASGMFDISGTMWMVYLLFIYGLNSIWIPWLWPVFNQIFMMVFLSIWLRRSGVMTGAEWIKFRFGESRGAHLSHIIVVVFALFNVIGFIAYGFIGIGKFAAAFLPYELSADPQNNVYYYGLIITAITTLYVVKGGMFSVVFTEVLQFVIMTIACVWVGIIAMQAVSPEMLEAVIPDGWKNPFFGWELDLDWTGIMETANLKIAEDGWNLFTIFFMMMLFKGWLQSAAGPAPNYDMQRVLSAESPKDAAKMSGLVSLVLLIPRYMLITGLTILALVFFSDQLNLMGENVDFELVLPFAMANFIPMGLLGLLIAALFAAFMSTYAATVNAAPAYIVNDIYKRYFNPDADEKTYVYWSYGTSILVVIVGTAFGFMVGTINDLIQWIVAALYGGYTASNLLKWYWWRFNSYGYFWGMLGGIIAAMIIPAIFSDVTPLYTFPYIFLISVVGCIWGTLATPPDDEEVLKNFYLKVRPWGFWGPIHEKVAAEYEGIERNKDFKRDMVNVVVGIIWQTALTATGIFLVIQEYTYFMMCVAVVLASMAFLKTNWYDNLEDYPDEHAKNAESLIDTETGSSGSDLDHFAGSSEIKNN
ncbi:sodium:solute symporter [Rhodohalobacter sp. SW132]|uniref:sodium:solute symporter family protein n=1 Tax=Rhodohalobacter sp. SW132 TaxID=2293433 RepID=UPI000E250D20|nr:sodium:solute symporter family protein [Rhodohalobacter sp. SW132]REL24954.1 sodium:solute symporter [Rhodohalobacter sp. SW132]